MEKDLEIEEIPNLPNGFTSWIETYYEIVSAIQSQLDNKDEVGRAWEVENTEGLGGRYELAKELTDKFENQYKGIGWGFDLEWFDVIYEWIDNELK